MKKFKKLVGLLLCLAMVLSFVPTTIIGTVKAATTTSDVLEKIDISGTVVGTCSSPYSSSVSYANQNWYSTQNPSWKNLEKFVDGSTSTSISYGVSTGERGDVYLDLTKKDGSAISADQLKVHYGTDSSSASMPTVTVILELADGSEVEETFTTNWSGTTAGDPIEWTFGQTYEIEGIYIYSANAPKVNYAEIELYQYVEIPYLETANLNGVDLSEYVIVYSADDLDYAYTAAEYIQNQILLRTGRQVDIVEDNTAETTYEILVGNTNRSYSKSISAPSETAMKFTFASNGTKIAMKADYFIIAGAAYYFIDTYIGESNFEVTANTGVTTQNTITKPAKNYIFMIGDGMGEMHTRLFEIYDVPTSGNYAYSDGEDIFYGYYLPYMGWQKTANVVGEITDSSAAGTALSTGYKTINGYVGKDQYLNDVKNMSELAMEIGKSVAIMSTEGVDGATPAAYSAHSEGRYDDEIVTDQETFGGLLVDGYNNYNTFTASEFEEWDALFKAGLNSVTGDPDGFFIMYEEAHIDKVSHRLNYTSSAGYTGDTSRETLFQTVYRFNQAIGTFMEYALYNPDTMVLITADHETAGLDENFEPTEGNPVDEQQFGSVWNHSLRNVQVFTYGQGADVFACDEADAYENTSIARTWAHLMTNGNADDFGDSSYPILGDGSTGSGSTNTLQPLDSSNIVSTEFGYYTDNNTDGTLTPYYLSGYGPENLIDGSASNQARSDYYLYSEIANKTKVPAYILELNEATVIGGIKITGYEYGRYNAENFEVQISTTEGTDTWVTVASWTDAFASGTNGNDVTPLLITFPESYTAYKVRVLISDITDMSAEATDDADSAELLDGSYIRIKEVALYYDTAATPGETPDPENPTTAPTTAPTEAPTQAPTQPAKQRVDLTGTVVGACSGNAATAGSYADFTWWSDGRPTWKPLANFVDNDLSTGFSFGASSGERSDLYLDLSNGGTGYTAVDEFTIYHSGAGNVPSVMVVLLLEDGTEWTKTYETNWVQFGGNTSLTETFTETKNVVGMYIWQNGSDEAHFGDIMVYQYETTGEPTEPTTPPATEPTQAPTEEPTEAPTQAPDAPVVNPEISGLTEVSGVPAPVIGYYTDINGTITSYTHDTYGPANLVNGDTTDQARSGYFTHAEIADGTKTPAILFNLGSEKTLGAIEIYGYKVKYYNMEDFEVQVYVDGAWKTVTATIDAFTNGNQEDDLTSGLKLYFDNLYTTSQVRILISAITDMSNYAYEDGPDDTELIDGSYIRVREIKLYEKVGGTTEPTEPEVTEPTTPLATEPTTPVTEPTTPVAPSDPIKQGTILQIVPASKLTTVFGYYSDGTGADEATFVDGTDGYCVTDGWYGRAGYSECTSAQGKIALVMTVNGTINLGGMEIVAHETTYDPVDFDVQALVNGQWVTVYSQDTNAFASDRTVMFDFGTSVTTSKVRILVNSVVGGTSTQCRLKEVTLYESTTGNVSQIIDLTGKGSSTDAGAATPITNLTDGDKSTNFIATNALFDLTVDGAPTAIDGFNLYCFRSDGNPFPSNVLVQIQKTAGGEYETIGTFSTGWTSGAIADALTAQFDQTYMAYSIRFAFDKWNYMNELELYAYERETASSEPSQALVGASYSIRLLEPWALRTFVTFATGTATNPSPIQLADIKSYGAYAIIEHKFDGTTVEDLIADADTKAYTSAAGTIVPGGDDEATTVVFDFTDEIYTHRLGEKVYWVAYYEDAEGQIHYTSLKSTTVIAVAETVAGQDNVSDEEKAVLDSMQVLKDAVVAFRGEDADLGNTEYDAGVSITDSGISFNQDGAAGTYLFGTSYQIRLIEPWSIRVDMAVLDAAANASFNFAAENVDYGMIFFHDRTGAYADGMSIEEMLAEGNALVYSKGTENIELGAESAIATYAEGIYTYELDTNLYCLPYVEVDGQYYYRSSVISWNLLEAMETYSQNTTLSAEEVAVFEAMLDLHAKTIAYRGQ